MSVFEYKKDVKKVFIQSINEKYGVNIQNLQNPASFKSLANTQVVIFEALSRLSPKGSLLKEVLLDMAQSLKTKSGVECIDVNDYLLDTFITVGYDELLEETGNKTIPKANFKRVTKDLTDIKELVQTLRDCEDCTAQDLEIKKLREDLDQLESWVKGQKINFTDCNAFFAGYEDYHLSLKAKMKEIKDGE